MIANSLGLVTLAVMLSATPAHARLPELGAPPQGTAQWIARSMRMNGLPMTLKSFESRFPPDAVLAHYESILKSSGNHETRRSMKSPWQVLLVRTNDHLITVRARAVTGGSEGTILVSPTLEGARTRLRTDFPRPPTARLVNLQQYDDAGMRSEHISLESDRTPFVEAQAFSRLLISDGWTMTDTRPTRHSHRRLCARSAARD